MLIPGLHSESCAEEGSRQGLGLESAGSASRGWPGPCGTGERVAGRRGWRVLAWKAAALTRRRPQTESSTTPTSPTATARRTGSS